MPNRNDSLTKAELLSLVRELERRLAEADGLPQAMHDLRVHQQELEAQREHLAQTHDALQAALERYQELFDFGPLPYLSLDRNGLILDVNLAAGRLLGQPRLRMAGVPFLVLVSRQYWRQFLDHLRRSNRSDDLIVSELVLTTRAGIEIPVEFMSRRHAGKGGDDVWLHCGLMDVTERRRVEQERRRTEEERQAIEQRERIAHAESEAKDRFLAVLSHELRTPLTPISLACEILRTSNVPRRWQRHLELIHRNVQFEVRLIDDLLDVSRIANDKLELRRSQVDAHALVQEVLALCGPEMAAARLQAEVDLAAAHHWVDADPTRLRQIVLNVVRNAVLYTEPGGTVSVRTGNNVGGWLRISVSDTGVGIEPDRLQSIFRAFNQATAGKRRGAGLGLGLAICKDLVEAHGGRIAAASAGVGKGSRFDIELPTVAEPDASRTPPDASRARPDASRPPAERTADTVHVLLVEDHEDTARALAAVLELSGYAVTIAGSVAQALTAYERVPIDLLVSDIGLPDGSGLDLVREVGRRGPVKAIALTGLGSARTVEGSEAAGFQVHLTKPVEAETLLRAIERVVHRSG